MFRNLSVQAKLALVIAPPLLAVVVLAGLVVSPRLQESQASARTAASANLGRATMQVIDALQDERQAAVELVLRRDAATQRALEQAASATDGTRSGFRSALAKAPSAVRQAAVVADAEKAEGALERLRDSATSGDFDVRYVTNEYTMRIDQLIKAADEAAGRASSVELQRLGNTATALMGAKEQLLRQGPLLTTVLETKSFPSTRYAELQSLVDGAERWLTDFRRVADAAAIEAFNAAEQAAPYQEADQAVTQALQAGSVGGIPALGVERWADLAVQRSVGIDGIEDLSWDALANKSDANRSRQATSATLTLLGALAALLGAMAAAGLLARSLARRLRRLADDAQDIVTERLPAVLEALRNPTPEALAGNLPEVVSDSSDEVGQMAAAFNRVLRTSVETSLNHSQQRSRTLTNLLANLGRRNQAILERQLELIDRLEAAHDEPALLEDLFRLDHMSTRMRRNAENLLVLASQQPARSWRDPVALVDVVRGAVAEVQAMGRVTAELDLEDHRMVAGRHAVDLSHLLAELIENATSFSPPTSQVTVRLERIGAETRVWIIDTGIGMDDEDLGISNTRLANPPEVDEMSADRVGFQVVGRLARTLGIQVRLQPNPSGGTVACVSIPPSLLETSVDGFDLDRDPPVDRRDSPARDTGSIAGSTNRGRLPASPNEPALAGPRLLSRRDPDRPAERPATEEAGPASSAPAAPGGPLSQRPVAGPARSDDKDGPATAEIGGLARRQPGAALGANSNAIAAEQGTFRRLPAAGSNGRGQTTPARPEPAQSVNGSPDGDDGDGAARRRLEMLERLRSGVETGRNQDESDGSQSEQGGSR